MAGIRKIDDKVSEAIITAGDYSAGIYTFGAILHSFSCGGRDVVVGYDDFAPYPDTVHTTYLGEVIGPFANRIGGASFTLDGRVCALERNDGANSLHSGSINFGARFWRMDSMDGSSVRLSLDVPEGGGFPGNHHAEVIYALSEDGKLTIEYGLESDALCPANMTNHAYFNLAGKGDVRNHRLTIDSPEYLCVDSGLIPTEPCPVSGTDFDFRNGAVLGDRRGGAYDHCFIFGDSRKAVLEADGYRLTVTTDLPAMQLYTGEFLSSAAPGKRGEPIVPFSGVAMETEFYPDFPNRPGFPGAYTAPGKAFRSTTSYHLERI